MADSTTLLRDEHRLILRVLDALEHLFNRGARDERYDFDALEKCVSFYRLFADACHHGKEEDLLFPELESRGMPREGGPIAVMLHEHRQGRTLVGQMGEALEPARRGDESALGRLVQAGRSYIELLRAHIDKEDNVLFNMADRLVDEAACQRLCGDYAHVCARKFEGHTKQQLEQLAHELSAISPSS